MDNQMDIVFIGGVIAFVIYKVLKNQKIKKQIPELKERNCRFIDVRSFSEFAAANANGTENAPLNEITKHMKKWDKSTPIAVFCASGTRSAMAKGILLKNGFKEVYNLGSWNNLK